jgi:hypothetical protein
MACILSFSWASSHFRFSWLVAAKDHQDRRTIPGRQAPGLIVAACLRNAAIERKPQPAVTPEAAAKGDR